MREVKTVSFCREYFESPHRGPFRSANQAAIDRIKREKVEPFWSYYNEYNPERLLRQFMDTDDEEKKWDLIPAEQYHNLLKRYMDNPIAARIPDNIVTGWIELMNSSARIWPKSFP